MDGIEGASLETLTHVTIIKFEDFNYRKEVKHPSWFRFQHSFFENPDFYEFTHTEKLVWIYLLCIASRKSSATFTLSWAHIEKIGGFKRKDFEMALQKLQAIQVIHVDVTDAVRARNVNVTSAGSTDRQTDMTDTVSRPTLSPKDLFEFWNENRGPLPAAEKFTDARKEKARSQLAKYPDIAHWQEAMTKLLASSFVTAEWRPGFDAFLEESKRVKAIEGFYEKNRQAKPESQVRMFSV
jgi:hypothetical protein